MRRFGILGRTTVAGVVLVVALVSTFFVVVRAVSSVRDTSSRATTTAEVIADGNRLERMTIDLETGSRGFVLLGQARYLQPWKSALATIPGEGRRLEGLLSNDPVAQARARAIVAAINRYESSWSRPLVKLAFSHPAEARKQLGVDGGKARMDAIRRRFDALLSAQEERAARDNASASTAYRHALTAAIAGALAILLLVALCALYLARVVVTPVRGVAKAMRAVARGDLGVRVRDIGAGETRELSIGFNAMADSLAHASDAIAARNTELEAVLASTADGISMLDLEGEVMFSNQAMGQLGRSVDLDRTATGAQGFAALFALASDASGLETFLSDLEADPEAELSTAVDFPDGRGFDIWSGPVRDGNQALVGRLVVVHDMTHTRELDRLKHNFVATVSHELRTPLTSMLGFLEILLEDADALTPDARNYLTIIERNTHRLSDLVGEILLFARLEAGHELELTLDDVDPALLLREAAEDIAMLAAGKHIDVTVLTEELPIIRADPARLTQLLANLTTNAIKFTPDRGSVVLRGRQEHDELVLEVSDTGRGVSASDRDRLFEPFFRSQDAVKKQVPGTGLGLPVALAIARAHDGTITIHDNPGGGTIFRLHVPVRAAGGRSSHDRLVATG